MTDKRLANCPTSRQLSAFVEGLLNHEGDALIALHLADCLSCETAVQLLESQSGSLLDQLRASETADPLLREPELQQALDGVLRAATSPAATPQQKAPPAAAAVPAAVPAPAGKSPTTKKPTTPAGSGKPAKTAPQPAATTTAEKPKSAGVGGKALAIVGLLAVAGMAALYFNRPASVPSQDPSTVTNESGTEVPSAPVTAAMPSDIAPGFTLGKLASTTPIEKLRVKIRVGETGDALAEPVDLHLGVGFPLRLFPIGTRHRDPAFAAFPQTTSLATNGGAIEPGTSVWFEFAAKPTDNGLDELSNSPQLLEGVQVGDIRQIGFASRGETNWTLDGYEISINDQLFASHGGLSERISTAQGADRVQLEELLPQLEQLESEVETLQAYLELGGVNPADEAALKAKQTELNDLSSTMLSLAGRLAGTHPWFEEQDPGLKLASAAKQPVERLTIKLMTAGAQDSGTQNSLYLLAGNRKFPISSTAKPLVGQPGIQEYEIQPPLGPLVEDLRTIGVGMLASDLNFGDTPDRAQLQRIVVQAADKVVYDSELEPVDRSSLTNFRLIPPAHRDDLGGVITNQPSETEVYLWRPGMKLDVPQALVISNPEPPAPPPPADPPTTVGGLTALPFSKPLATKPPGTNPTAAGLSPAGLGPTGTLGAQPVLAPSQGNNQALERLLSQLIQGLLTNQLAAQLAAQNRLIPPVITSFNPAVTPTPTPAAPVISGIRFRSPTGVVVDNRPITVNWKITGNTSAITHFEVTLNPVAPHLARSFISTPIAQNLRATGTQTTLTPNLTPLATTLTAGLIDQLWVQPLVKAKNAQGQTVGLAQTGPLLPLFTRKVTGANQVPLVPGPVLQFRWTAALPPLPLTPGYKIGPTIAPADGFTGPWLPYRNNVAAGGSTAVIPLGRPTSTHNGFLLDAFGSTPPFRQFSQNMAIKPTNAGEAVTVRFDATGVNLQQNMQLIGHLGFLNSQPGPAQMQVQMFIIVTDPTRPASVFDVTPNDGNRELLRLATNAPIRVAKLNASRGPAPLGLLRIPLNVGTPTSNYNAQLAPQFGVLTQRNPLGVVPQTGVNITVVFMVNMTNPLMRNSATAAFNNESIGIYGLRIVPQ